MSDGQDAESAVGRLVDELEANRAMFEALCSGCRGERLERAVPGGRWTVQDHLAHVASYDELAVGLLRGEGREVETALGMPDSETWNEAQVARRAGRTLEMLLDEMGALRERSVGLLTEQTAKTLQSEVYFSGDSRRSAGMIPLRLWLERWSRHDMIHARWILAALPEFASNADFQSWLADDPVLEAMEREEGGG